MNNSRFFQECVFIANIAMKHPDPTGKGIESGIRNLKRKRWDQAAKAGRQFNRDVFEGYAESFRIIAKCMVENRIGFLEGFHG